MSDPVLLRRTEGRVLVLTLNRPEARNALSADLRDEFFSALVDAESDDDVDVVIITGSDPAFCAGMDLKELGSAATLPALGSRWPTISKPVIGAINGVAITGGFELALSCDILIASERARFADTHARVGLLPRWGLSVRLPRAVGPALARRMSLTGDFLSADDALAAGLVTQVVAHDILIETATALAESIVTSNQGAVRALLASYHRIDGSQTREALALEAKAADAWRKTGVTGTDIAAARHAVTSRGRGQLG